MLSALGEPRDSGAKSGGYFWTGVSVERILEFLGQYETHPEARRADTRLLSRYIRRQNEQNELVSWSVALVSSGLSSAQDLTSHFGGRAVGSINREYFGEPIADRYTIRRLVSPTDEALDLSSGEETRAIERTVADWRSSKRKNKSPDPPTVPSGKGIRSARPKSNGLLLLYPLDGRVAGTPDAAPVIGMAISFPESNTAKSIEYTVNNVFTVAGDYDDL